jgi:hypothetical protein
MSKNQFYFQGKYFDTPEEMFDYSHKWNDLPLEQESAERMLAQVNREIVMNTFLLECVFTNGEFREFTNNLFDFAIKQIMEKRTCQAKE